MKIIITLLLLFCVGCGDYTGGMKNSPQANQDINKSLTETENPDSKISFLPEDWTPDSDKGKIILLDFWASWCGPCIRNIPQLKKVYEKYKNNPDFKLVSVSLDNTKKELLKAINKYDLPWHHHFQTDKAWKNELALAFKVNAIPAIFILRKDGKVIADNLHRFKEISELIDSEISKN